MNLGISTANGEWDPLFGPSKPNRAARARVGRLNKSGDGFVHIRGDVDEVPWAGNVLPAQNARYKRDSAGMLVGQKASQTKPAECHEQKRLCAVENAHEREAAGRSEAPQSSGQLYVPYTDAGCVTSEIRGAALRPPSTIGSLSDFARRFSFARDCTYKLINYNKDLTELLMELQSLYECKIVENDDFRATNMKKLIETIKRCPFVISAGSWEDFTGWFRKLSDGARKNSGIGTSWMEKLEAYTTFGYLQDLEDRRHYVKLQGAREFVRIFGVGPVKACFLVNQGFTTLQGLREAVNRGEVPHWRTPPRAILEADSLKCLPLVEEIEQRISSEEAGEIRDSVLVAAERVYGVGNVTVTVCGSYRRGKSSCGDVDILISTPEPILMMDRPGQPHASGMPGHLPLEGLIKELHGTGLITHDLRWHANRNGEEAFQTGSNPSMEAQKLALRDLIKKEAFMNRVQVAGEYEAWRSDSLQDTLTRLRTGKHGYDASSAGQAASAPHRHHYIGARGGFAHKRFHSANSRSFGAPSPPRSSRAKGVTMDVDSEEEKEEARGRGKGSGMEVGVGMESGIGTHKPIPAPAPASGGSVDPSTLTYLPWPSVAYDHEMWMGIIKLPGEDRVHRRVDIKSYPREIYPFAILYFTGSGFFNRSLRLYVQKCGWSLSDRGLCPSHRERGASGKGWDKVWEGHSIACRDEKDVFAACGLPYLAPSQRECSVAEVSIEEALDARERDRRERAEGGVQGGTRGHTVKYVMPGGLQALQQVARTLGPGLARKVQAEMDRSRGKPGRAAGPGGGGVVAGCGPAWADEAGAEYDGDDDGASVAGSASLVGDSASDLPFEIAALMREGAHDDSASQGGVLNYNDAEEEGGGGGDEPGADAAGHFIAGLGGVMGNVDRAASRRGKAVTGLLFAT